MLTGAIPMTTIHSVSHVRRMPAGRLTSTLGLILSIAGACSPAPTQDPAQVVHVQNHSNRAVMVLVGDHILADDTSPSPTAVRPCGDELTLPIHSSDYEDDGRLQMMLAIDQGGLFDQALSRYEGDPASMPGSFTIEPLWSDGTLAGRLPLFLTIGEDLRVNEASRPPDTSSMPCVPAY
jgi:hypothetical protein